VKLEIPVELLIGAGCGVAEGDRQRRAEPNRGECRSNDDDHRIHRM